MHLRRMPEAKSNILASPLVFAEKDSLSLAGHWQKTFCKNNHIRLEIGMGKGRFITAAAVADPDNNYLGLEFREEMVWIALKRLVGNEPDNLRFIWANAALLGEMFNQGEIATIYLNFSDPWPKPRHAKRRLTHAAFLRIYHQILSAGGELLFKTDNRAFFDWSLTQIPEMLWQKVAVSYDLPLAQDALMTEYEERYRLRGQAIYFFHLSKKEEL